VENTNKKNLSNYSVAITSNEMSDNEKLDASYKEEVISQQFSQIKLNDLVRDLNLSKELSELLASRLTEKNLLQQDVKISYFRQREKNLLQYFVIEDDFAYFSNIKSLMNNIGVVNYYSDEWRLLIDSSKRSLKCVLLQNGNKFGSIPIAHSVKAKETYKSVKHALQLISYQQHKWIACVGLKTVCFLLGQQLGYTKYPCFLCLWDSRAKSEHWERKD